MSEDAKEPAKTYSHGEITVNHNSDLIRFEGPDVRLTEKMPKSMSELENLIYQVIEITKNTTYITLSRENEEHRQTVEEW